VVKELKELEHHELARQLIDRAKIPEDYFW